MEKIRIMLVDDHNLVRDGIKALLGSAPEIDIVGEASDSPALFESLGKMKPDLLIMDISLPGISGIEVTRRIASEFPEIRVLMLSMYNSEEFIVNSLKAGAKGYLQKDTSREELLEAIHTIYRGEEFFGQSVSEVILKSFVKKASRYNEPEGSPGETLTSRETEILRLYVEGFINKEISDKLEISIRTVETHKNHIMKKLGLKSTVELVKFAIKNNIVSI